MNTLVVPEMGIIDDVERDDEDHGYERDETDNCHRLGALLKRLVAESDARIPVERRAPRTLADMRARIHRAAGRACQDCDGTGGETKDTSSGGVTRRTWHSCSSCRGTGESR
ncbi:hypothetical protein ACFU51_14760 [Streptomyces sp. NPDC057430]|uniref:hypothetical protein n=1 Tax=Streptomyces sp. NPDC057430 TaxID=3346131 RepID=UPI0036CD9555